MAIWGYRPIITRSRGIWNLENSGASVFRRLEQVETCFKALARNEYRGRRHPLGMLWKEPRSF
jgi:hypothetical protein